MRRCPRVYRASVQLNYSQELCRADESQANRFLLPNCHILMPHMVGGSVARVAIPRGDRLGTRLTDGGGTRQCEVQWLTGEMTSTSLV